MSHIETGQTRLVLAHLVPLIERGDMQALATHPSMLLLRQALGMLTEQYSGEILPTYRDYYNKSHSTNTGLALHIPYSRERPQNEALPRGIGLIIDEQTGALTFVGDRWGVRGFYEQIQKAIVQNYTVLAHMAALEQMRYQVETQQVEGTVQMTGVRRG